MNSAVALIYPAGLRGAVSASEQVNLLEGFAAIRLRKIEGASRDRPKAKQTGAQLDSGRSFTFGARSHNGWMEKRANVFP